MQILESKEEIVQLLIAGLAIQVESLFQSPEEQKKCKKTGKKGSFAALGKIAFTLNEDKRTSDSLRNIKAWKENISKVVEDIEDKNKMTLGGFDPNLTDILQNEPETLNSENIFSVYYIFRMRVL